MRKQIIVLLLLIGNLASAIAAVTNEQVLQTRNFLKQKASPSDLRVHWKVTLVALQNFAKTLELSEPNLPDLIIAEPCTDNDHFIWELYQNTYNFCAAYDYRPRIQLSADPNQLNDSQRQGIYTEIAERLDVMEEKLVDQHIQIIIQPLMEDLKIELNRPTLTYVSFDGIQRNAITERAKILYDQIIALKNTKDKLVSSINGYYLQARIDIVEHDNKCLRNHAERVVNAWFERKLKEIEKYEDAQARRGKGVKRIQQQQEELVNQAQTRQPARQYPVQEQTRHVNGGKTK